MVVALHLGLSCIEGISAAWSPVPGGQGRADVRTKLWAGVLHQLAVGTRIELEVSVLAALSICVGAACACTGRVWNCEIGPMQEDRLLFYRLQAITILERKYGVCSSAPSTPRSVSEFKSRTLMNMALLIATLAPQVLARRSHYSMVNTNRS